MKSTLTILLFLLTSTLLAQSQVIEERLTEYGIRLDFLEHSLRNTQEKYVYKYKLSYGSPDGTPIVDISEYNPKREVRDRWQLLTVNGRTPKKKELKKWSKLNNERGEELYAKIDPESYEVVVDNPTYFTFSFKYKPGSVSKNRKFLEDCIGYVYVHKKEKAINGVRYENFRETEVRGLTCTKLVITHELQFDEATGIHLLQSEDFDLLVKFLGKEVELEQLGEYFDYERIK